jgi:hypothetical protein
MIKTVYQLLLLTVIVTALNSCSKQTDTVSTASIGDYYPLTIGSYSIYQLDSTVYVNYGQSREVHSHVAKDLVDATITDNMGRPSFRIRRLFRSTIDTSQWIEHATYLVTPLDKSVEVVEENLRIIKLQLPITNDFSWNGNRYLSDDMFPEYGFNSTAHSNLGSWEYNYQQVNSSEMINGHSFDSTITVTSSIADSTGFPPISANAPAFKTVWEEKYAKGVGLISRKINLEEFQPGSSTYPNGYYSGFAVKQTLIRHN